MTRDSGVVCETEGLTLINHWGEVNRSRGPEGKLDIAMAAARFYNGPSNDITVEGEREPPRYKWPSGYESSHLENPEY